MRHAMATLRRQLVELFDDSEIRTICFDLSVDYDGLPGSGKADKARELLSFLERDGRLAELLQLLREQRPRATWSQPGEIPDARPPQRQDFPDSFGLGDIS